MNGRDGLRGYTTPKAVLRDRFFGLGLVPKLYPVRAGDYAMARKTIRFLMAPGLLAKLKYLGKQAKDKV